MTTSPIERAADQFVTALAQWRVERGMTKKQLAARMGFDPSYVSHVEGRRHKPTEDFARRAEAVLGAGGAIWQRFQEYDELRHARGSAPHRDPPVPVQWLPPGAGLVVEREIAELAYVGAAYRCRVRRSLYNAGVEPVTRYLVKVAVDRYPNDPAGSNRHHREHPLTFDEMDVQARAGEGDAAEPMRWRVKLDRDAAKEIWLLFANERGQFPLYPGERTTIEYAYTVGEQKWGQWFQRAVRLPTRSLTVRLNFPERFEPQVWGVEVSLAAEVPVRSPLERRNEGGRAIFEWSTDQPLLNARYRLEWRFRGPDAPRYDELGPPEPPTLPRASHRMRGIGIVQRGSDLLRQRAGTSSCPGRGRPPRRRSPACSPRSLSWRTCTNSTRGWAWPRHRSDCRWRPPWSARRSARWSRWCCSTRGWSASRWSATSSTRAVCPSSTTAAGSAGRCASRWSTPGSTAPGW